MNSLQILINFKAQIIALCEELSQQLPSRAEDFIMMKLFFESQIPIESVMTNFIKLLAKNDNQAKNMIKERNSDFFVNNPVMRKMVSQRKIDMYASIWQSDELDEEDKTSIWEWIDVLVQLTDAYQNNT